MISQWKWHLAQFFEIRWWKVYLKKRDKKSYLAWKSAYWQRFLEAGGIPVPRHKRILDAGCGPAGIFIILQDNDVWAIDPLLDQYARQLIHFNPDDYPWVQFDTSRLEDWQPPEKRFDLVFCLNALNHVRNLERTVQQLHQCLHSDGRLVLSVDAHRYRCLQVLFTVIPGDILHPQQYCTGDYVLLLEKCGFRVERIQRITKTLIFDYQLIIAIPNR